MTQVVGRLRDKWASVRARRRGKRREQALKHVEARTDRDRYSVQGREGVGGGGDGGFGGGGGV